MGKYLRRNLIDTYVYFTYMKYCKEWQKNYDNKFERNYFYRISLLISHSSFFFAINEEHYMVIVSHLLLEETQWCREKPWRTWHVVSRATYFFLFFFWYEALSSWGSWLILEEKSLTQRSDEHKQTKRLRLR